VTRYVIPETCANIASSIVSEVALQTRRVSWSAWCLQHLQNASHVRHGNGRSLIRHVVLLLDRMSLSQRQTPEVFEVTRIRDLKGIPKTRGSVRKSCGPVIVGGGMTKISSFGFPSNFNKASPDPSEVMISHFSKLFFSKLSYCIILNYFADFFFTQDSKKQFRTMKSLVNPYFRTSSLSCPTT